MNTEPSLLQALLGLLLFALLVVGVRHFVMWFFGINQMLVLLKEISLKLGAEPVQPEKASWFSGLKMLRKPAKIGTVAPVNRDAASNDNKGVGHGQSAGS